MIELFTMAILEVPIDVSTDRARFVFFVLLKRVFVRGLIERNGVKNEQTESIGS